MKIAFFVHRYWPSIGGVEKYIHELGRALVGMGHHVEVVAGAHVEGLPSTQQHEGIRIHRFPAQRSPLRCRLWLLRHRNLFTRADVVSISNTHMLEYYWRMLGPLGDPRNVFLIRHGMACDYPVPESQRSRARRSWGLAAGVVHDGHFIEKWLGVKPDLCPDQGLNPRADELPAIREPEPNSAIYIGRLGPDTGIRIYTEAVRLLNRNHRRRFALHVYGDGSLLRELQSFVERESLPVIFHGQVPSAQDHISDCCFAFMDGRMAIQEAMARRRLVLAAYVDPLKHDYVAGERFSSHLVTVANAAELARHVMYYIDHAEERAELVNGAFEYSRQLDWAHTARAYLRFWREKLACSSVRLPCLQRAKLAGELEWEALTHRRFAAWLPRSSRALTGAGKVLAQPSA